MGLFNNFEISGSAMNAQSLRLNLIASNLANANSASSSVGETYRSRHAVFQTMVKDFLNGPADQAQGVQVMGVVESEEPLRQEYRPEHPLANEEGYVFYPNVNAVDQFADMINASRSYQMNVEVLNTSKQMLMRTLSLGQS